MKIKICDNIIDASQEPVMIIFDSIEERKAHAENILQAGEFLKYCVYPDYMSQEDVKKFKNPDGSVVFCNKNENV